MPTTSPAVELILARLRESGDFPAMAKTVGSVSALTSSEDTSISALADTVLQDYGLAQKLLRLVNTLAYAQHGQVTTVSRAGGSRGTRGRARCCSWDSTASAASPWG